MARCAPLIMASSGCFARSCHFVDLVRICFSYAVVAVVVVVVVVCCSCSCSRFCSCYCSRACSCSCSNAYFYLILVFGRVLILVLRLDSSSTVGLQYRATILHAVRAAALRRGKDDRLRGGIFEAAGAEAARAGTCSKICPETAV